VRNLVLPEFNELTIALLLDRFFQTSTASSDSAATQLDQHGLIVASTTAALTCTSEHSISHHHHHLHHDGGAQHQLDKHGNLMISPKSEVL